MIVSIHLSYVLGGLPIERRFETARKLGFQAVEYPFPYELPARDYARLLDDNGLSQISIGAPACDYKGGEPGFSLTPARQSDFDRSIDTVIAYATAIRCANVHVFAGPRAPDVSPELAFETYCRNLAAAHDRLKAEKLNLVIEAVNSTDFPGYFIDRLDMVMRAIAHMERPDIKVILDVYHAHVNHEDPIEFLTDHAEQVAHIQLADYPGRHEPGTGSIDFDGFFKTLGATAYRGSIGLEYVPTRAIEDGIPLAAHLGLQTAS